VRLQDSQIRRIRRQGRTGNYPILTLTGYLNILDIFSYLTSLAATRVITARRPQTTDSQGRRKHQYCCNRVQRTFNARLLNSCTAVYVLAHTSDILRALAQQFYRRIAKGSRAARVRHVARILTSTPRLGERLSREKRQEICACDDTDHLTKCGNLYM
jgi:hypothetical protein